MSPPWHHQYRLTSIRFDNASELPPLSTVTRKSGGPGYMGVQSLFIIYTNINNTKMYSADH
jgi:hypothetical protein